jgi:hypothetical protein
VLAQLDAAATRADFGLAEHERLRIDALADERRGLENVDDFGSSDWDGAGMTSPLRERREQTASSTRRFRAHVFELVRTRYADFGPTLAFEKLATSTALNSASKRPWILVPLQQGQHLLAVRTSGGPWLVHDALSGSDLRVADFPERTAADFPEPSPREAHRRQRELLPALPRNQEGSSPVRTRGHPALH